MREIDIRELLEGIADAAFVVELDGLIRLFNQPAALLFFAPVCGVPDGRCYELLQSRDAFGRPVCQECCIVREQAILGRSTPAFDAEALTTSGRRWLNITTALVRSPDGRPLVIHVARDVQLRKQVEQMTRQFLGQLGALSGDKIEELLACGPSPHYSLSQQERTVLRLLVQGQGTKDIADSLHISESTARNHVEHILRKLAAHNRVEAVVRAIREKLV